MTTDSRVSIIHHCNTEIMAKNKDKYIFYFSRLHKNEKKGQAPPAITCFAFCEETILCVVDTSNECINRPKPWRDSNLEKQLLVCSIRP